MSTPTPTAGQEVLMAAYTRMRAGANADARLLLVEALREEQFGPGPGEELVYALRMLGEATRKMGELEGARGAYEEARQVARELGRRDTESGAVEGLAQVARVEGEPELALRLYDEAAALAGEGGDERGRAAVLSNKGNFLANQERFEEAEEVLREAVAGSADVPPQQAAAEDNLAVALGGLGRHEEAIVAARQSAELFGRLGAGYDRYLALRHLEESQRALGRDEEAAETFVELRDLIVETEAENLAVEHYDALPERIRAIEEETQRKFKREGKEGAEAALEIGVRAQLGTELGRRADLAFETGDFATAESDLLQALQHWQELGAFHELPRVYHTLGIVYSEAGQLEQAREFLLKARGMAHQLGDAYREMSACTNLARLPFSNPADAGELDELQLIARARALRPLIFREEGRMLFEPGEEPAVDGGVIDTLEFSICLRHRAFDLAESLLLRSIETIQEALEQEGEEVQAMRYRLNLRLTKLYGMLRRRDGAGDAAEADALAARLDGILAEGTDLRSAFSIQSTLGGERFARDAWDEETLERLAAACDQFERMREQAIKLGDLGEFASVTPAPFAEAIEVAIRLGEIERAFHLLERSKSRSLLDALSATAAGLAEVLDKPVAVAADGAPQMARPATRAELAEALARRDSDPLLIELFIGRRGVFAFTLDGRGELEVHELGEATSEDWRELHELVHRESLAGSGSALQALTQPALREISDFVRRTAGDRPAYVSPHRILHALPLHLVEEGGSLTARPRTFHLPSGSLLLLAGEPAASGRTLVGGNPTGDLPFAALEAEAVARRYHALASIGADCTAEWLGSELAQGHGHLRLTHLACHAFFHPRHGERSGLLLSGGERPVLATLGELVRLDWSSDLVFLSSCSSGQHEVREGDELSGISRTLLGRGAKALIVALWEVPDLATYLLVEDFYGRLPEEGELSLEALGSALAGAQHAIRDMSARELVELALRLRERAGEDPALLSCALSAAGSAHIAAGNVDEWRRCNEAKQALADGRQPAPDIGTPDWSAQADLAASPGYDVTPFADPAEWAAFVLVARG